MIINPEKATPKAHQLSLLWDFCRATVKTEDLDPTYCMLRRVDWPMWQKHRFLASYYMFYHAGLAAKMSVMSNSDFWQLVDNDVMVGPNKLPRKEERRHWRGVQAQKSLQSIRKFCEGDCDNFVQKLVSPTYMGVRKICQDNLVGFGDYFIWKIADIQDRVLGIPCDPAGAHKYLPEWPRKGAQMFFGDTPFDEAIEMMKAALCDVKAPPDYDRPINIYEIETLLCMAEKYFRSGVSVGDDLLKKHQSLEGCGPAADDLIKVIPPFDVDIFQSFKDKLNEYRTLSLPGLQDHHPGEGGNQG